MNFNACTVLTNEEVNEALYASAHALLEQERPRDAAAVLRLLLVRTPTDPRAWLALGWSHECCDDEEIASWLYEKGLEVCDDSEGRLVRALDRIRNASRRAS
ncbi:MAG: tetratricopeptide repeat protein [Deltaproteobacteria bacterium]|nr:tetratricopeptide repeat protein [Deltaproteobacteria bacterium]